ncbi:MAG: hypothetical protein U1A25_00840 [Candidatus Sungbacteria bacterium]|nr:hypothetical protein [bacterium]MDZ4260187.1 hypothetical protein [Candidatus Sungbacteria bacterium]
MSLSSVCPPLAGMGRPVGLFGGGGAHADETLAKPHAWCDQPKKQWVDKINTHNYDV